MTKRRFNFIFDLQNIDHAKAYAILDSKPSRGRSAFIIQAILATENNEALRKIVVEAVRDAVGGLKGLDQVEAVREKSDSSANSGAVEAIPTSVMSFLESL